MNCDKFDVQNVQFTDNLTKAFESYQAVASNQNAKIEGEYLKNRMVLYMKKVNELREEYYQRTLMSDEQRKKPFKSINYAFKVYFQIHRDVQLMGLDGEGPMTASREIIMSLEWLHDQISIQKADSKKIYDFINRLAYLQIPFFGDMQSEWALQFSDESGINVLFFYLALVKRGIFFLHKYIGTNIKHQNWVLDPQMAYTVIFTEAFNEKNAIVGAIMPMRLPQVSNNRKVTSFEYQQYVYFTEITKINKILSVRNQYAEHKAAIKEDPDLFGCFQYSETNLRFDRPQNELQVAVYYKHIFSGDIISYLIRPLKIFKWMLKEPPCSQFDYDETKRRWIKVFQALQQKEVPKSYQQAVVTQQQIVTKMTSEKQAEKLARILDMMPTLKIKLSPLQQQVVKSNCNLLCLGRSGTGKTTTSVLRLFAQEVLYIILKKHEEKQKEEKRNKQRQIEEESKDGDEQINDKKKKNPIKSEDLATNTGMKMVFVTASPVLSSEVKRFYGNLKRSLVHHLQVKEENQKKMQMLQEQTEQFEEVKQPEEIQEQIESEIDKAVQTLEDQEKKELLDFMQRQEQEVLDDINLDQQLTLPNSFSQLQAHHFPLFITVKKLVYMMDACLTYSYFSRDSKNNIIGLDNNLGWHNESKGVMMINHYYRETIDYNEQISKFGKEILDMDKDAELAVENEKQNFQQDLGNNFYISEELQNKDDFSLSNYKYSYLYRSNQVNEKYVLENQQLSFEVDYDIFEQKFWPKIGYHRNMKKLSPTLVWTEIYSVIKGGMKSNSYYQGYLPRQEYVHKEGTDFLTINEKKTIYYIFLQYEKWKQEQKAFDFNDVVNHVIKRIWYGDSLRRMSIDFLMVDEVQDLTPKTLQLFLRLTKHNVFFAGDTAQTIAKGVSARFTDLRHLFSNLSYEVPKIVQLTKNYRSHGKILDLANSVVNLIELFFPKTIDRLVKEESEIDGLKPLVIMPLDQKTLKSLFFGTSLAASKLEESSPQFGCNQVLIVRDQEAKESVPMIFRNMLCLSVYEAKGLEFDDVILYNFFHWGDVAKSQWKILNDIIYENVKRLKYNQDILDFDSLDVENFHEFMRKLKEQENQEQQEYVDDLQLSVKTERAEINRKFSMLCIELKFLYVSITRPKRRLIIYDDVAEGRKPIQQYWEKLGVIEVITKESAQDPSTMKPEIAEIFQSGALTSDRSNEEEWRIQGIKLFKKKYYDSAIKCFEYSNDPDLVKRCKAYQEADIGSEVLGEADAKVWRAKEIKYLPKQEKKKLLKESKRMRIQAQKHFFKAGMFFEDINMKNHSASCYFTSKNYEKAAIIFELLQQYGQAGECMLMENQLTKAASLFEKGNLISRAIDTYEAAGEWELLLNCLHRNKNFFRPEERECLVNKYVPVALNSLYRLYSQIETDQELDEENRGKLQEMKLKLKYQKQVDTIREQDEEGLEDDEDEDQDTQLDDEVEENEQTQKVEETKIENEGEQQENQENDEEAIEIIDDDEIPDILNEVFQLKKQISERNEEEHKKAQVDHSFEIIEQIDTSSKQKLEGKLDQLNEVEEEEEKVLTQEQLIDYAQDFEHLSQYDPEDEFLRSSKSVSIIESILSKKSISQTSEFSIISSPKSIIGSASIITSKSKRSSQQNRLAQVESNRDIYAEDVITQKIIYYVSLFSEEVFDHLKKLRSTKALLSNLGDQKEIKQEDLKIDDFLLDLDDIEPDFVNLILDALEYYELFRLCLMICNRYHMSERLGRYIISVCSKYSNLHQHRFNINLLKKVHVNLMWSERQRQASILSHEAIHNVFSLIGPQFLGLKDINVQLTTENSLGLEAYRMMIDLGFWKKLVYILNGELGLKLCELFIDKDNFENLKEHINIVSEEDKQRIALQEKKILAKDFQLKLLEALRNKVDYDEKQSFQSKFKEIKNEYLEELKSEQLDPLITIAEWIFTLETVEIDSTKKNVHEQTEKQQKQIDKREQLRTEKALKAYEEILKEESYLKYIMIYQLALGPQTQFYNKLLNNMRNYFTPGTLNSIINTLCKTIQQINLEVKNNELMLDALYSTFLVSSINDEQCEPLFQHYSKKFMIMNVNSPLLKDVLILQQSFENAKSNQNLIDQLVELRPKYFKIQNFKHAAIKLFKDFQSTINQKHAFWLEKHEQAFILDMDAQFLMVPKNWIIKLSTIRLLSLSISLANEMRKSILQDQSYQASIEDLLNIAVQEIEIMQKVKKVLTITSELHSSYSSYIQQQLNQQYNTMINKNEFVDLIKMFWQKINFQPVSYAALENSLGYIYGNTFTELNEKLKLCFDQGRLHQVKKITSKNEILAKAFTFFDEAFSTDFNKEKSEEEEEDHDIIVKRKILDRLFQSLKYFMLCDNYEYMVEMIKIQKRKEKGRKDQTKFQLLTKFMLALDIHFFMKCGMWSLAADSIFKFVNAFYTVLTFEQKLQMIQNAFYLVLIGKQSKVYVPDYALLFLDIGYDLSVYYTQEMLDCEKIVIDYKLGQDIGNGISIEKIQSVTFFEESLYWCQRLLADMNKDQRASVFKKNYKNIYNILMSAIANEDKLSKKATDYIIECFTLLAESCFDEYFLAVLGDYEYNTKNGINEMRKAFASTENSYKHEFFASFKSNRGQYVAFVDVSKNQTQQDQTNIQQAMNKLSSQEIRNLTGHLILNHKVGKLLKRQQNKFKLSSRAKQYSYEDRKFSKDLGLYDILMIDQIPGQPIIYHLNQEYMKQIVLRQMIVAKYATNSIDLHYILGKATDLDVVFNQLLSYCRTLLQEKGSILKEFEDLEDEVYNEAQKKLSESKLKLQELNTELNQWMIKKAEPNLIDVEIKSRKYKLKWENLNMFEKRKRLIMVIRKQQQMLSSK